MQKFKIYLLTAILLTSATFAHAQTVNEIVNRYIDSIGGKEKISQINSLYMEASSQIMGNDAPVVINIINGKDYKSETSFNGQKIVRCYTDKGGWTINPFSGGDAAVAIPDDEYKTIKGDIFIGGALYNYAVNNIGTAELEGKDGGAYKIKFTSPDSIVSTYYIDTATYYLDKMMRPGVMQGQQVDVTTSFSNYKQLADGILLPYTTDIDFGGNFSLTTTISKVELNKTIDPAIFEMPKS